MKKGISLVALIITIIVLIILTAAVVITGANTPENTQLAVWKNDISAVQDAVTLTMLNNMAAAATDSTLVISEARWNGVTEGNAVPADGASVAIGSAIKDMVSGISTSDYFVDNKGVVYSAKAMPGSSPAVYNLAGATATFPQ